MVMDYSFILYFVLTSVISVQFIFIIIISIINSKNINNLTNKLMAKSFVEYANYDLTKKKINNNNNNVKNVQQDYVKL